MSEFFSKLEHVSKAAGLPKWEGTFRDYLRAIETKEIIDCGLNAHQRVEKMILDAGVEKVNHFGTKRTRYKFFEDKLFGVEETIDNVMAYIHSAARRTETSKRMLLLFGPPGAGKCLAGDTEIYNAIDGRFIRLEDIVNSKNKLSVACVDHDRFMRIGSISNRQSNGIQRVFKIKTLLGREIRATFNHKFLTFDDWTQVCDLKVGDRIATARQLPEPLRPVNKSESEIRFAAYMISEGGCRKQVGFTNTEPDIFNEFGNDAISLGEELDASVPLYFRSDYSESAFRIVKSRNHSAKYHPLIKWLKDKNLFGKLAIEKTLPDFIFSLPNESLAMFFGRLWSCDGYISGHTVSYSTSSYRLAEQISVLLLRFGIIAKLRYKKSQYRHSDGTLRKFDSWVLDITDSTSVFNFSRTIAKHLVAKRANDWKLFFAEFEEKEHMANKDVFPADIRWIIKEEMKSKGMLVHARNYREPGLHFLRTDRTNRGYSRFRVQKIADTLQSDKLDKIAKCDVYYDEIISIEQDEKIEVYDIEVPKFHNFVANGFVTHNSELSIQIKRGLEKYTKQKEGYVYALKDSKMHENPFLLVPEELRSDFCKEYGVSIEGNLSPHSQWRLDHEFHGNFMDFPIERIFLSEPNRIGIGTFLPADSKCLTDECVVFTDKGPIKGSDLFPELIEKTGNYQAYTPNGFKPIKKIHINGIQPVYEVKLRGTTIEATKNHRFLTLNSKAELEFTHVRDILGKSVAVKIGANVFGNQTKMKLIDESVYSDRFDDVNCPEHLNNNLAKFAGYLISEGSAIDYSMEFSNENEKVNEEVRSIIAEEFLIEANIYTKVKEVDDGDVKVKTRVQRGLCISKQRFVDYVNLNFGVDCNACEKEVPTCIMAASREHQLKFLEGLFIGDGSTRIRPCINGTCSISYNSCSKKLISQLQSMIINMGVYGCITSHKDPTYPKNTQYTLSIQGEDGKILSEMLPAFMLNRGWDFAEKKTRGYQNYESYAGLNDFILEIRAAVKNTRNFIDDRYLLGTKNRRSPSRLSLIKCKQYLESDNCVWKDISKKPDILRRINTLLEYRFIPVVNTKYIGTKPVFDLEIDSDDHLFIVNGLVSHNSQDQSELVGSIDFSKIQDFGDEGDPRAYVFNGELNVANRGMLEMIEGIKADERFLRVLLTATQERNIKAPRFGLIFLDCFIMLHTNETEFLSFISEKKYEAYHDRMVIVKSAYNLGIDNEVMIYEKLLSNSDLKNIHIAPNTLRAAAMFAILSRLEPSKDGELPLIKKMKLYNQEQVKGFKLEQVPDIRKKYPREGMFGISPRFVIDQINAAMSKAIEDGKNYITPLDVLRQITKGIQGRDVFKAEEKNKYRDYLETARKEWSETLRNDIQKAFFLSFDDEAKTLCSKYVDQIEAYCSHSKPRDPITNEEYDLDEKLMESIENHIEVSNSGKEDFRNEILRFFGDAARKNKAVDYSQHVGLKEAIQKQLFAERQGVIRMTVSTRNPDSDALRRLNEVIDRMVKDQGYSAESANELLKYATDHCFDR